MTTAPRTQRIGPAVTLPWLNAHAIVLQGALLAAAVVLPAAAHATGAPVRWLLPMHWPVILAGLAYGPGAGLLVGLLAPAASLATSGMPPAPFVFVMMAELGIYGFAAGWLREKLGWSGWLATALALLCGRGAAIALGGLLAGSFAGVAAAYAPGIPCAIAQIVTLPHIARWWVARQRKAGATGGRL